MTNQPSAPAPPTPVPASWFATEQFTGYRRHPHLMCEDASIAVLESLAARGVPARIVEFVGHDHDPGLCHCVVDAAGTIVDLTLGQFEPDAPWPCIEPVDVYARRFSTGPRPVALLDRWDDAGCFDTADIRKRWKELGITQR